MSKMDTRPTLDIELFGRIWSLAETPVHEGSNTNEREVARRKAEAMAARAGMTLNEAVSALTGKVQRPRIDFRMPASFEWHHMEWALHHAGADMITDDYPNTEAAFDVIRDAVPMPRTIRAAVVELDMWVGIEKARRADSPGYRLGGTLRARFDQVALHAAEARATCTADAVARVKWWSARSALGAPGTGFEGIAAMSIAEDMERMANRIAVLSKGSGDRQPEAQPAPLRRTNAMKRAAVSSILDGPGGDRLTLRQVAELAGVSPETVRAVKRNR